jgi:two-component system nitrogen regulation sensor histidine kinase GlnL
MTLPAGYYERLIASLPDAVVAVDRTGQIILWNPAAEALFDRSATRALGRPAGELLGPGSQIVRDIRGVLASGESRLLADGQFERRDGRTLPISLVASPLLSHDGAVTGVVAIVRDLSRLKQLEDEVRRGERLSALGGMAVGIAHEIRNPLGAIRGAAQLLRREAGPGSPWEQHVEVMFREIDRVNRIMEQLLDLARPIPLNIVPVNLAQLLDRILLLHEEIGREQSVQIVRHYDPSLPPVPGDEDRLAQVFLNLVKNGLEAMPGGGTLTIATRLPLTSPFETTQRALVEVQVRDEGEGIAPELLDRVFDPFVTTKTGGLGLGLAIAHRIIEEHQGAITVESHPGKGTAFSCFLPFKR